MKKRDKQWREKSVLLACINLISRRRIAEALGVPRSTCLDHIRNYFKAQEA